MTDKCDFCDAPMLFTLNGVSYCIECWEQTGYDDEEERDKVNDE